MLINTLWDLCTHIYLLGKILGVQRLRKMYIFKKKERKKKGRKAAGLFSLNNYHDCEKRLGLFFIGFVVVVVVLFRFVYFDFFVLFLFLSFWAVCLCALFLFSVSSRERKKKKGVVVFKCTVAGRNKTESQILKH